MTVTLWSQMLTILFKNGMPLAMTVWKNLLPAFDGETYHGDPIDAKLETSSTGLQNDFHGTLVLTPVGRAAYAFHQLLTLFSDIQLRIDTGGC